MSKNICACACLAVLVLLLAGTSISAQVITGDVTGSVTDQSGSMVADAVVSAVCPDTGQSHNTTTGTSGEFRFTDMPACVYKISVSASGFKTTVRPVTVTVAQITKADFRLEVGDKNETITVEAAAPLVDYSAGINNDVDTERIVDLPTNGRDFKSILALTPGVQRTPGGGFLDVSISGQRSTANNYLIDGMYNNDRFYGSEVVGQPGVLGVSASVLPNDAIAEYTVQQLPSAEYGIKGGASVNVTLKSGTNDFHGEAYYFGHWSYTDAANDISKTVIPLHNHQYGAQLGGPIKKDRTFFFVNYEAQKNISKPGYKVGVPTQGDINQALANFSCTPANTAPCQIDPATSAPIITNTNNLPINPAGQALVKYFTVDPSLTPGGAVIPVQVPNTDSMNGFIAKVDHKINDKMQLSARYAFSDSLQSAPQSGYEIPPNASAGPLDMFNTIAPTRVQMAGVTWTYSMSPNKIWDTRFNWTRYAQILDVNNKINPKSLGIDTGPLDPLDFGVPYVYAYAGSGYIGGVAGYPLSTRPTQTFDVSEHFSWIKDKHTIKIGGNYQYASTYSVRNRARSSFTLVGDINSSWISNLDELLLGRVDQAARSFGDTSRKVFQPSVGLYVQDEWKVSPRVTVSYGLRWDINGALGEGDKIGSNFSPTVGLEKLGPSFPRLYNVDKKNFGPRAGLAWDIFGNGKTALRVGYALTYDVANFSAISAPYSFHGARAGAFTNSDLGVFSVNPVGLEDPSLLWEQQGPNTCYDPATNPDNYHFICIGPLPGAALPYQTYGANPTGTPPFNIFGTIPDLRTPRIHYYSATLQHEVFKNSVITVSYVGTKGQNLLFERALNDRQQGCGATDASGTFIQYTGDAGSATNPSSLNCNRPFDSVFTTNVGGTIFPSFNYIMQLNNDGYQRYNALQASFRQRDWHNLNIQYNFTWSNCIDNNSVNRGGSASLPLQAENPYNPKDSQGPCDTDVRLNFNLGGTYTVPRVSSLGRMGQGWEIGSVFTALTGRPFTAVADGDSSGQDFAVLRADCLEKPIYDYSQPTFITNRDTAFAQPADGQLGTCGRNSLRGPGFKQMDASVIKLTALTERLKLQFRWEVFNVLNHPNFNPAPARTRFDSGLFGSVTATPDGLNPGVAQGSPRVMQFGLKLIF